MGGWKDGRKEGSKGGKEGGREGGRVDGWVGRQMDGCMEGEIKRWGDRGREDKFIILITMRTVTIDIYNTGPCFFCSTTTNAYNCTYLWLKSFIECIS